MGALKYQARSNSNRIMQSKRAIKRIFPNVAQPYRGASRSTSSLACSGAEHAREGRCSR